MAQVGRVSKVRGYPVKSAAAADLERAKVGTSGIEGDRSWAVVDAGGQPITAGRAPQLRDVVARLGDEGPVLQVPGAGAGTENGDDLPAEVSGERADAALSAYLGQPARLAHAESGYLDVAPLHVVSLATVTAARTGPGHPASAEEPCPCSVEDPRANLWLDLHGVDLQDGEAETAWVGRQLRVGSALLRISGAPQHCLGVYAEVVEPGTVSPGDPVNLLD